MPLGDKSAPAMRPIADADSQCDVTYTAVEFYRALVPTWLSTTSDPAVALEAEARLAHAVAVLDGFDWSPRGRYPISVWIQIFR